MEAYTDFASALRAAASLADALPGGIIAVDGRCAAGKSTFAARLGDALGAPVVHMDDFFLRPEQRTQARYAEPGGNVDRERLLEEVLLPLREGTNVIYRPFDCASMALGGPVSLPEARFTVVEGSYALHPALREFYALKLFLTCSPATQLLRLSLRCPERLEAFKNRWIPLEEAYFDAFDPAAAADLTVETAAYYVYILRCADDSLYTGITTDIRRRFAEHSGVGSRGAKYTRARRPAGCASLWLAPDHAAAARLEHQIKSLSRAHKLQLIAGTRPCPVPDCVPCPLPEGVPAAVSCALC